MEFARAVLDLCWSIRFLFLIREDPEPALYFVRGSDSLGDFRRILNWNHTCLGREGPMDR